MIQEGENTISLLNINLKGESSTMVEDIEGGTLGKSLVDRRYATVVLLGRGHAVPPINEPVAVPVQQTSLLFRGLRHTLQLKAVGGRVLDPAHPLKPGNGRRRGLARLPENDLVHIPLLKAPTPIHHLKGILAPRDVPGVVEVEPAQVHEKIGV